MHAVPPDVAPLHGWHHPVVRWLLLYLLLAGALATAGLAWLPLDLTLRLGQHVYSFHDVVPLLARNLIVPAMVLPLMFLVEIVCQGWHDSSLRDLIVRRDASARSDLALYVLGRVNPLIGALRLVLTLGLSELSGDAVRLWFKTAAGVDLSLADLPLPLMALTYLLVHTFLDYWAHRLQHTRVFWPVHRFHHAATEFSLVTADRIHPGDFATLVFSVFLLGLFKVSTPVYLVYALLLSALRFAIHSRIDSDFGWAGRYLVLSPGHHRAHHIGDEALSGGNFGLIPLWDVVFGTLRPPVPRNTPIGVDTPYRHGYWMVPDLLRDSRDFLLAAVGLPRAFAAGLLRGRRTEPVLQPPGQDCF